MSSTTLEGILPVIPTPFLADGAVDLEGLRRVVRFAVEAGVAGVVYPGFASEVSELSSAERESALAAVVTTVAGTCPVVAGATASSAKEVIGHGRLALSLGVDHLMVQPPLSLGAEADAVLGFFSTIATALPTCRLILQNAPAPRGSDLSADTLLQIAEQVPQVVYVKEETLPAGPSITRLMRDKPPTLLGVIGGGGARYILDEYRRGACGAMPAVEIVDLHVMMDAAWRVGDVDTANALYVSSLPLLTLQAVYRMRLTKHVLVRRGVLDGTGVRAHTPLIDSVAAADIDDNLVALGLLEGRVARQTRAIGRA